MKRAVIYQHDESEGPEGLGDALVAAGFELDLRVRGARQSDVDAPLVVVLGGAMSVYQTSTHPFLLDELKLLRERLLRRRPSLGICLGAQLLAAAGGARVSPGASGPELGVYPVTLTEAGRADPILSAVPPVFPVLHWHQDAFMAVPGATLLGSSEKYPWQAFSLRESYGFQFHPEVDSACLLRWVDAAPEEVEAMGRSVVSVKQVDAPALVDARFSLQRLLQRAAEHLAQTVG